MSATAALDEALAQLIDWRRRGAQQVDPVGFLFIEALARRAGDLDGEARRLVDARLGTQIAAYQRLIDAGTTTASSSASSLGRRRGPLGQLADTLRGPAPAAPGLRGLDDFRETWARVSADQRLRQALAQVPVQAGPINSEHLVHRALMSMRDLSPDYLRRFVAQVDTLTALERLIDAQGGAPGAGPTRQTRARGTRRRRAPDA